MASNDTYLVVENIQIASDQFEDLLSKSKIFFKNQERYQSVKWFGSWPDQDLGSNCFGKDINKKRLPLARKAHNIYLYRKERSGSLVECLTRDRGVFGLSITGSTTFRP